MGILKAILCLHSLCEKVCHHRVVGFGVFGGDRVSEVLAVILMLARFSPVRNSRCDVQNSEYGNADRCFRI